MSDMKKKHYTVSFLSSIELKVWLLVFFIGINLIALRFLLTNRAETDLSTKLKVLFSIFIWIIYVSIFCNTVKIRAYKDHISVTRFFEKEVQIPFQDIREIVFYGNQRQIYCTIINIQDNSYNYPLWWMTFNPFKKREYTLQQLNNSLLKKVEWLQLWFSELNVHHIIITTKEVKRL